MRSCNIFSRNSLSHYQKNGGGEQFIEIIQFVENKEICLRDKKIKPVDKDNNLFLCNQVGKYFSGCISSDEKENFEAENYL